MSQKRTEGCGCTRRETSSAEGGQTAHATEGRSFASALLQPHFVIGVKETPAGPVPRTTARLVAADHGGTFLARWGIGRMHYTIPPGLYAIGDPNEASAVFVTANYKMSFDRLREALPGRDAWILVLDTAGINVWCAAGKGTFGTAELVARISASRLAEVVSHRRLILPQLGAPGVAAHEVKKLSGFKVVYGPIQARDLPSFLDAGLRATDRMRRKSFTWAERLVLIPVELTVALKAMALIAPAFFFLGGLGGREPYWVHVQGAGVLALTAFALALLGGTVLFPLLLPWLPGRAFSLKALPIGLIASLVLLVGRGGAWAHGSGRMELGGWLLLVPALTTFLAMNFTGASTFTSLSGVRKEIRWSLPFQIAAGVAGLALWLGARLVS